MVYEEKREAKQAEELGKHNQPARWAHPIHLGIHFRCLQTLWRFGRSDLLRRAKERRLKRRKGLPDLDRPTDLPAVAGRFHNGFESDDPNFGFFSTVGDVVLRLSVRLDPKRRWP